MNLVFIPQSTCSIVCCAFLEILSQDFKRTVVTNFEKRYCILTSEQIQKVCPSHFYAADPRFFAAPDYFFSIKKRPADFVIGIRFSDTLTQDEQPFLQKLSRLVH